MIVGEHPVRFEHVAVFAALRDIAAFQQTVEVGAQRIERVVQAFQLALHVLRNVIRDDDARLVQHDVAERDAV